MIYVHIYIYAVRNTIPHPDISL